ncbi:MAG TPA: DUF935 family protein, partial [Aliidongia sp.]|uniref:phage portal protein family protein n=1 Tax=Aliidongia sp. TaxID=1914230 RepID=UPI002DDD7D1D
PLDGGAGADADTEDRLELARSDADNLAQVLNKTIVAWIVWINMPAARPPALAWEIDAEEDLTARADRDGKVNAMGFDPSEKYINETYGGEWTKKATPEPAQLGADGLPVPAQDAESNPENPSFAEQHEHAPPAGLTETLAFAGQAADQADKVIAGWVDQARKMFADAGSLEEARDRLLDLYPGMSGGMFAEVMTQAIAVSNLAGREGVGRGK